MYNRYKQEVIKKVLKIVNKSHKRTKKKETQGGKAGRDSLELEMNRYR